jgi:23S rRNA (cytidine1920-2'-O)/16S rRNA (cytidine1409-2'-O)-methyltransferase
MSPHSPQKTRLDSLLVSRGLVTSREKARALIMEGKVLVDGKRVVKAGMSVQPGVTIEVLQRMRYVGRGGLKLEAALGDLHILVRDKVAMDVGASTGGFTDCLLQHGARKVYAIDVGYGQFAWELRNDPRVILLEKTNIRYLSKDKISSAIDIATIDVSFISLLKVMPKVIEFLSPEGEVLALIKPQFEVERKDVGKGGVVKDEQKRREVVERRAREAQDMGLEVKGVIESPYTGPKGNVEYFMYLVKNIDHKK